MPNDTQDQSLGRSDARLSFEQLVEGIDSHAIEAVEFSCPIDPRYSHCRIAWEYDEFPSLGKKAPRGIKVTLGKNRTFRFVSRLNPSLIEFKNKNGRYLLRDVWGKCVVTTLMPATEDKP